MAIAMHPYVTGVGHRVGYFKKILEYIKEHDDILFMRGVDILDWYNEFVKQCDSIFVLTISR